MHLTKIFCVNLIAFLGVYGKTKDTEEAHQELQRMVERDTLYPQQRDNGRQYLSPASYTLSKVLTLLSTPDLYTASALFLVAFPSEYSPKVYQSTELKRQETIY